MGKRGRKPQHTLDAILDAALAVVESKGLRALSMSELARQLQTSVSGLYRYVDNLEHLFVALQIRSIEMYRVGLEQTLEEPLPQEFERAGAPTAALAQLVKSFRHYSEHAKRHPANHRLLSVLTSEPSVILSDEAARTVDVTLARVLDISTTLLGAARNAGALSEGDDQQRTYMLWAALHGVAQFRKRDRILPPHLQTDALQERILHDLLLGFGAQEVMLEHVL